MYNFSAMWYFFVNCKKLVFKLLSDKTLNLATVSPTTKDNPTREGACPKLCGTVIPALIDDDNPPHFMKNDSLKGQHRRRRRRRPRLGLHNLPLLHFLGTNRTVSFWGFSRGQSLNLTAFELDLSLAGPVRSLGVALRWE